MGISQREVHITGMSWNSASAEFKIKWNGIVLRPGEAINQPYFTYNTQHVIASSKLVNCHARRSHPPDLVDKLD